ncbi:hypothetical protein E3P99_03787 [Wallemia hederae]|uniref:Helicase C-terminal domain-containing protein n=1 Tax=Wallemia hederae TaxID=1540922 RepID=A0A4T0FDZ9_9BASI|nr:hypothetical protein E3P99_03787 [Wallemia hederae]
MMQSHLPPSRPSSLGRERWGTSKAAAMPSLKEIVESDKARRAEEAKQQSQPSPSAYGRFPMQLSARAGSSRDLMPPPPSKVPPHFQQQRAQRQLSLNPYPNKRWGSKYQKPRHSFYESQLPNSSYLYNPPTATSQIYQTNEERQFDAYIQTQPTFVAPVQPGKEVSWQQIFALSSANSDMSKNEVHNAFIAFATSSTRPSLVYQNPDHEALWRTTTQALCGQLDLKASADQILKDVNLKSVSADPFFTQMVDEPSDNDSKMSVEESTESETEKASDDKMSRDAQAQQNSTDGVNVNSSLDTQDKADDSDSERTLSESELVDDAPDREADPDEADSVQPVEMSSADYKIASNPRILIIFKHPPEERLMSDCFGAFAQCITLSTTTGKLDENLVRPQVIAGSLSQVFASFSQLGIGSLTTVVLDDLFNDDDHQETLAAVAQRMQEKARDTLQVIVCCRFFSLEMVHDLVCKGPLSVLQSSKQMTFRGVDDFLFERHLAPDINVEQDIAELSETTPLIVYCAFDKHAEKLYEKIKPLQDASGLIRNHTVEDVSVLERFKRGDLKALVTTPILSRSKTIEQCPLVVIYSAPWSLKQYANAVGRPIFSNFKAKCIVISSSERETNYIRGYKTDIQPLLSMPNDYSRI